MSHSDIHSSIVYMQVSCKPHSGMECGALLSLLGLAAGLLQAQDWRVT
jgi:hypothetical protein